jgi:probable F420-dependent oxidoreductase
VRLGIAIFGTDLSIDPARLAVAAEERGFVSLYFSEHTHIPVSRLTPAPTGDAALPAEYSRTLDPLIACATAAAVTRDLLVGTGVTLLAQREPIVTAKAIATLDHLSGGRFVLGIGFGWNREEAADHGVDFARRRDVVREHLAAMRALWEKDVAEYAGAHVRFAPSWAWPKPVGGPPVLVGGAAGPTLFAHIAEYADGWMPIGGRGIREALPDLRRAAERAGRDPAALRVVPFGTDPSPGKLDYYASLGIDEVALRVPSGGADEVLPVLDRYAAEYLR